jgi:hypothetical protein
MPPVMSARETLDREFLGIRGRLLEVAAALDRIDRAHGSVADDARRAQLQRAMEVLLSPGPGRAERFQQVFSLAYDEAWRSKP